MDLKNERKWDSSVMCQTLFPLGSLNIRSMFCIKQLSNKTKLHGLKVSRLTSNKFCNILNWIITFHNSAFCIVDSPCPFCSVHFRELFNFFPIITEELTWIILYTTKLNMNMQSKSRSLAHFNFCFSPTLLNGKFSWFYCRPVHICLLL
jgi:hypothetical protein